MSISKTFRVFVNERLTAAAEEIVALFERTIAEYEEELRRPKEETELQDSEPMVISRVLLLHKENTQAPIPSPSPPGLNLNQETTTKIKEESEELQSSASFDSSSVYVKEEFLQEQTEHRGETQGENFCLQSEGDPEHDHDTYDWGPHMIYKEEKMDLKVDVAHHTRDQIRDDGSSKLSPPKNAKPDMRPVNNEDISETDHVEKYIKKLPVSQPYSGATCQKVFANKSNLVVHKRLHTNKKTYACLISSKCYDGEDWFSTHKRIEIGQRLFSCSLCRKSFSKMYHLNIHMRSHTGEKPYKCRFCDKAFSVKSNLTRHLRIHTEENQYLKSIG